MNIDLRKVADKVISNTCKGINLKESRPVYIPIKCNKVSVSGSINSLKGADECILLLPYIYEITVPNRYGPGNVTFLNTYRKIVSIDEEGNVFDGYFGDLLSLHMNCNCSGFGANVHLCLKYKYTVLYTCKHSFPTVEDIHELWKAYVVSKKLLDCINE